MNERMRVHKPLLFASTLLLALLGGCGFLQGKKDAEALLVRHFQALSTNGVATALADYGPAFFQTTPKEQWTKALTRLSEKLGAYQSHKITSWNVHKGAGMGGAGTTVKIQCDVAYAKHPAKENFTLFKGVGDSEFKITGHNINSVGLLTE